MDIALSHSSEFPNLFSMMGIFHMAKVALHCAGRYFKGSGIDTILILAKWFGSNTIESVLSGGHYVRFLFGMQIIKEGFEILKWKAFWAEHTSDGWVIYKDAIKKLCLKLCSNVSKDVFVAYDELCQIISKMKTGIKNFENERSPESDMCKYVLEALKLINLVEMLVAADRDGKWKLHLAVAEELMQVFLEFDSINYVRHAPWYLEQIKALENPYLNEKLIQGHFVVKDKRGKLNSVSPDMKLEQTIQKASKDPDEIIG